MNQLLAVQEQLAVVLKELGIEDGPVDLDRFQMDDLALVIDESATLRDCATQAVILQGLYEVLPWYCGDLFRFIRDHPDWGGVDYTQWSKWLDHRAGSLKDWVWVADAIPRECRTHLSWTHHRIVSHLSLEEITAWLARAQEEHWSTRDLRAALKGELDSFEQMAEMEVMMNGEPMPATLETPNQGYVAERIRAALTYLDSKANDLVREALVQALVALGEA